MKPGWLLFGLYTALVFVRQKDSRDLPLTAAAVCFAFYMLPTRIHSVISSRFWFFSRCQLAEIGDTGLYMDCFR
jgi:hypothetical protein